MIDSKYDILRMVNAAFVQIIMGGLLGRVAVTRGWSRVTPSNPESGLRIFLRNSFADFFDASGGFFTVIVHRLVSCRKDFLTVK